MKLATLIPAVVLYASAMAWATPVFSFKTGRGCANHIEESLKNTFETQFHRVLGASKKKVSAPAAPINVYWHIMQANNTRAGGNLPYVGLHIAWWSLR